MFFSVQSIVVCICVYLHKRDEFKIFEGRKGRNNNSNNNPYAVIYTVPAESRQSKMQIFPTYDVKEFFNLYLAKEHIACWHICQQYVTLVAGYII